MCSTWQTQSCTHPTVKALQKQGNTPTLSLRIVCGFSDVLLLSCTVVSRAARNGYLLADVFFCISVHHGGGCSYMGVYNELQHYNQGRNIT